MQLMELPDTERPQARVLFYLTASLGEEMIKVKAA